jgi:alkanesulfonate monooxygenase SsuD/methylene tetrahydromethanopterin reductase-like flavin-dependent oxidoreductase (luciferase family)
VVRIGIAMLPADPWPVSVARARHIERLGFAHLWTYDHLSWRRYRDGPWFGAVPWLTGIAAATSRIRLGTMVASPNFRHPVTLAKDALTLDHVSDGRLTLGIGAGGIGFDATVLGQAVLSPRERADRLADFLEVLDGLLTTPTYSTTNARYPVDAAQNIPPPVQRPRMPFLVAAAGPRTLALAARYGQGWVTFGREGDETLTDLEAGVAAQAQVLTRQCEQTGRDPDDLERVLLSSHRLSTPSVVRDLLEICERTGMTDLVLHDPRPGDPQLDADPHALDEVAATWPQVVADRPD